MINSNTCPICQQNTGMLSKFCGNCGYSFAHPIQTETSVGATCSRTFGLSAVLLLIFGQIMFLSDTGKFFCILNPNNRNDIYNANWSGCNCGCQTGDGVCCFCAWFYRCCCCCELPPNVPSPPTPPPSRRTGGPNG